MTCFVQENLFSRVYCQAQTYHDACAKMLGSINGRQHTHIHTYRSISQTPGGYTEDQFVQSKQQQPSHFQQ